MIKLLIESSRCIQATIEKKGDKLMINKIEIQNYRSISKQTISLKGSNVFIGENSAGKSTVLNAILSFYSNIEISNSDFHYECNEIVIRISTRISDEPIEHLKLLLKTQSNTDSNISNYKMVKYFKEYFGLKNLLTIEMRCIKSSNTFHAPTKTYHLVGCLNREKENIVLSEEVIKKLSPRIAYLSDERNFHQERNGGDASYTSKLIQIILSDLLDSNMVNQSNEMSNELKKLSEYTISELNAALLEKIGYHSDSLKTNINEKFRINHSTDLEVTWKFDNQLSKSLLVETEFIIKNNNGMTRNVNFMNVGSGTRSIYILSLMQIYLEATGNTKKDVLFLIEEPELYLFPKLQREMGALLAKIANKSKTQLLVTSHSPLIANAFPLDNIKLVEQVEKNRGKQTAKSVTEINTPENIHSIIERVGVDLGLFSNKSYIIFVEGVDDLNHYRKVVEKIFPMYANKVCYIKTNGVNNIQYAANLEFIKHTIFKDKFLIIRDRDGKSDENIKKDVAKNLDQITRQELGLSENIFITEYNILEGYTMRHEYLLKPNQCSHTDYTETVKLSLISIIENRYPNHRDLVDRCNLYNENWDFEYFISCCINKNIFSSLKGDFNRGWKLLGDLDSTEIVKVAPRLVDRLSVLFDNSSY